TSVDPAALSPAEGTPHEPPEGVPTDDAAPSADGGAGGLSGLPAVVSPGRLVDVLRDRVAAVLGLAPERVDLDRPLMALGLDSLTAMELKAEIESSLGAALPLTMLLEGSSVRSLAAKASVQLDGAQAGSTEQSAAPRAAPDSAPAPAPALVP